jgi:nucleoside phosphorylase
MNNLNIKFILVPQGAEYNAVSQGLKNQGLKNNVHSLPEVVSIPVGGESVRKFLDEWLKSIDFTGNLITDNEINPPRVLVMGLCGGLNPELRVGDIVVYDDCRQISDDGILFRNRAWGSSKKLPKAYTNSSFTAEVFQFLNQNTNLSLNGGSESLKGINRGRREIKNPGFDVSLVAGLTSNTVISTVLEKRSLYECYGANVVDMEGWAIIEVLNEAGFSVATVRVVSDDCFHDIPNLSSAFNSDGSLNALRLAIAMLRQPIAAIRLIRGSLHGLKVLKNLSSQFS